MTKKRVKQTDTQLQVLKAINTWRKEKGFAPSHRNLARETGKGQATVTEAIDKLREYGLVSQVDGRHGSLDVSPAGKQLLRRR